jgi:hypothetical protein
MIASTSLDLFLLLDGNTCPRFIVYFPVTLVTCTSTYYQEVFSKFVLALEWFEDTMPVYLYVRGEDYSNHFMLVRNSARAAQSFVDRMDWLDIHRFLFCPKKKAEKPAGIGKQRQDKFHDSGLCCGESLTRVGTSGVAEPRMKPGTMQNATVLDGYAVLREFIVTTPVKRTEGNDC